MAVVARFPLKPDLLSSALGLCLCWHGLVSSGSLTPEYSNTRDHHGFVDRATPLANERLSDWLLRHQEHSSSDTTALMWQVPSERDAQADLKRDLLLEISKTPVLNESEKKQWFAILEALPVTGRVRIDLPDARWLQAHPDRDPILRKDHLLRLPRRAITVTALSESGSLCTVPHTAGAQARDYLRTCFPSVLSGIDYAWLIQPDGRVQQVSINHWNAQTQGEAAPGALIWAPARSLQSLGALPRLLPAFLATQAYDTVLDISQVSNSIPVSDQPQPSRFPARSLPLSSSDWGTVGLLQTPTARMVEAGDMRIHFSRAYPYERLNVFVQPFEWLEAGFRYTNITNRLYGPADLSGSQSYKDKSIDFKARLLREGPYQPQLAVGMIDFGGTGLFASEYIVASKRYGNFDGSLGIAWGYLGSSGNIPNPLSRISPAFDIRSASVGMGGTPAVKAFFRGPAALFGGVQYHTPWSNWVLKAEYDGNNYRSEPLGNNRPWVSPVNLGVVYRLNDSVDLSFAIERGNTAMLGLTLHASAPRLVNPKVSDPPAPRIRMDRPQHSPDWAATAADMAAMGRWGVTRLTRSGSSLQVEIEGASGAHWNERIERIVRVLHRDAPFAIDTFELVFTEQGVRLSARVIDRHSWARQNTEFIPPSVRVDSTVAVDPASKMQESASQSLWSRSPAPWTYSVVPSWQQVIGGPDGFLLFRAGLTVPMQWRVSNSVRLSASWNLNFVDNFGKFRYTAPSDLPRVRTYLREYMTSSRLNLTNLQLTHMGELTTNHFYSLYGGYLEGMFAGVGVEWLYRPWHSPWAWGIDVNRVQQRSFDQLLGFDHAGSQTGYKVTTGHLTSYWDTGWHDTRIKLSVGKYLAGDVGATVDVGKTFKNGVSMGAWFTKTNVSAERFGEGSFDKGLYLRIPFDVMASTRSGYVSNIVYNPLTRDGGARLNRELTLFAQTVARSQRDTGFAPATARNNQ